MKYWILDPGGHRREWAAGLPQDGEMIDTSFGEAVAIVPAPPDDLDDWICDYCSETVLTRWGKEPFPVPSDGSYALCSKHFEKTRKGQVWPARFCGCTACVDQAVRWKPKLQHAYRRLRSEVISQN